MTSAADRIRDRRRIIATPGSRLDSLVRLLAVALPGLVGVIVALMLVTPLSPGGGDVSFLLDRNKVAVADDRMRVDRAMYRGLDQRGRPFLLMAGEAVQESAAQPLVRLQDMVARIVLDEGPAQLSADQGTYDIRAEQVRIPGLVRFAAADGYVMTASNVEVDLRSRTLVGIGQVRGETPAGTFSADSIRADLAQRTLVLQGNARLRMVPDRMRMPRVTNGRGLTR